MRRGAKPTKPKVEAKSPVARKSRKSEGSRVRDLEKRLAEALQREAEALKREAEAQEQQAATAEILSVISSSPTDVQPVFESLVVSAARLCGANDLLLLIREADVLRPAAGVGSFWESLTGDFRVPLVRGTVAARSAIDGATLHFADLATLSEAEFPVGRDLQRRFGHHTVLAVPLMREGVALGTIFAMRFEVRPFADQQVALLKTFADHAVIAIENVRLFNETTEALEQQTATAEILRVISTSPTDVRPVFDTIVQNARRLCGADSAGVLTYDGKLMQIEALDNANPERARALRQAYPMPANRGQATGRAILTGRPVHIPDVREDSDYALDALRDAAGLRSLLSVPMVRDGVPIGAVAVQRWDTPRPFSDKQIALLKTFADQAVIAIENVRLFTELQEKNHALTEAHAQVTEALDQQTATADILRVISSSPTDAQPVFDPLLASAVRLCGAAHASLYRLDDDVLHHVAARGIGGPLAVGETGPIPPRSTAPGRAVHTGEPVHVMDVQVDVEAMPANAREFVVREGVRTVLAVPLLREGVVIGVIVIRRTEVRPFVESEIRLLKTFADQAVIAIENVRLFKELEARNSDLSEALEQQTATSQILRVISSSPTDVQPVFDTIVRSALRLCNGATTAVFRVDGGVLHHPANYGGSPEALAAARSRYPRPVGMDSIPGIAILTRSEYEVPDTEDPSAVEMSRETGRILGIRSLFAVPILREGEAVGAIVVTRREPGRFAAPEVSLLKTFADQAVIAIENVRLFKELESRNRDLGEALEQQTATSQILSVISSSPTDVEPVFETILGSANRLCEASFSVLWLWDGEALIPAAHANVSPKLAEHLRTSRALPRRSGSPVALTALELSVIHVPDVLDDPRFSPADVPSYQLEGARSILSVPMLREGSLVGVINTWRREPRAFTDKQITLLKTFADQAVIAIENVRLFTQLEARTADLTRSVGQLTALGEVGRAVSSTLDLETVLTTIVSRAVQLTGLDGGVVFEYDEGAQEFVQRAATETGGTLAEARRTTRIPKGEGVLGRTAITLEPVQVPDIAVPGAYESRLRENLIESGIRAILAVPMMREGRIIGCLGVTRNRPGEFPAETIALLRTFATQSALAIQNARLFHELADKSRQLEAASRHKSEFLANMSHELRTPLNAVIGFSEVLLQRMFGELNDKQDEYLKDIYASGQHLLSLINDILDLSKVEAGRMELASAPFHLPTALENAITLVKERAARHGIALELDLDPRLGELVGDERKVKQVLLNLLSNAVKFTPEGGRISLKASRKDGAIEISVIDTGIGIAPDDQAAIFEEFRQVGSDDTRKQEGTGLGLTLAKKFVELHGGRIWVESEVGRGSTFTFTLPLS